MWITDAPSSTARLGSAAYSSGVYGIAGHWSRFATAPLMLLVITTGSARLMVFLRSQGARFAAFPLCLVCEVNFGISWRTSGPPHLRTRCGSWSVAGTGPLGG